MFKILAYSLLLCASLFAADIGAFSSISASTPSSFQRSSVTMQPTYSEGLVDSTYKLGPGDYLDSARFGEERALILEGTFCDYHLMVAVLNLRLR